MEFAFVQLVRRLVLSLVLSLAPLTAASANPLLLVDMTTAQVLYEQEAGQPWHPASLTKLMTAFVAFEAIARGEVTLETKVILSRNAVNQSPSKSGLPVDSALTLRDALYILIVKSANDVAVAIAETISGSEDAFVARMNQTAAMLGMSATHFVDPNGLASEGQVTTARDLAVLSLAIRQLHAAYFGMFGVEEVTLGKTRMESNNNLLTEFAGTTGMKTGYICASGLNVVATASRNGRELMVVVLGSSSGRERGEMAAELLLRGYSGAARSSGKTVAQIGNIAAPPVNMRPKLCGKEAKAYIAEREAQYPMGLEGQLSYLNDEIEGAKYAAVDLGRIREVPLPRPRPGHAPVMSLPGVEITAAVMTASPAPVVPQGAPVPMPRPRPRL